MNWASGNFLFPTSTGTFSVTGIGFSPQGLFFIGTNNASEDVLVTDANAGLFFGMVWIDKDAGTPDSQAVCLIMQNGINVKPDPIVMATATGCDVDYAASLVSLNADGFTLNVTNAAPAARPITWLALGEFTIAEGSANLGSAVYSVAGQVLSSFAMNYRTSSGIRDGCEDGDYTTLYLGGGSYPKIDNPPTYSRRSWGSGGTSRFAITGLQGFTKARTNIEPSPQFESCVNISTGDFPPIVLEDRIQLWRENDTQIQTAIGGGPLRWMAQWWNGESWINELIPSLAVDDVRTFTSGNPFLNQIDAAIYIGVLGPDAEGLAADSRLAVGLIAKGQAQGVVAANRSGHLFQSRQYGCCDWANASGVHAASGVIEGNHIDWTTEINTSGLTSRGALLVYGGLDEGWLPQIYRRWPS